MLTLAASKSCSNQQAMMSRALKVISFYGFVPFEEAPTGETPVVSGRVFRLDPKEIRFVRREERRLPHAIRMYATRGLGDRRAPAFLFKLSEEERGGETLTTLELHIVGIKTAAAEALLITIADAIAHELGIEQRLITLNSIGTGESADRYLREITSFLRKHEELLSSTQRERMEHDPLGVLLALNAKMDAASLPRIPSGMDYLSEEERRHFWDVLEYLELANKSYELSPTVVGSSDCWSHTLFEISYPTETEEGVVHNTFALGGRYDVLAVHSLGVGATAACVTITFNCTNAQTPKKSKRKPSAYLAHLGVEAKRRSIPVLEMLRAAEIPVYHSLAHDQIGPQMALVKSMNIPWLLLVGQKEAMADEVAVRNVKTNAQDTVPFPELVGYLRRKHVA